uniref:Uncharacterized protein n=1 Tax=Oryza brachyantha TaxID=4533 RepID=J3KXF1_ORYBR
MGGVVKLCACNFLQGEGGHGHDRADRCDGKADERSKGPDSPFSPPSLPFGVTVLWLWAWFCPCNA